ncbi:MAG: undecaprenyl-diphosphate phosphatase [candidate division Zixibacteria bacterium]|nr:undecaprenyl-diphosphate phosphatase [candidate division Zixibacteria bacterium]
MNYLDAIILGVLQGLTEFLPVSSSGHLVLTQHLLGVKLNGVVFELLVHFGTLMAVLIYFRERIIRLILALFDRSMKTERRMILFLILGTIPAVVVALLFDDIIEEAFSSPVLTSVMLVITGFVLLLTGVIKKKGGEVSGGKAFLIGCGQALAIFPGISRSGSTIAAGMFVGIKPMEAAEFSFLLSIPAIAGAIVFKLREIVDLDTTLIGQYAVGTAVSFLSGLFAVYLLLSIIKKGKFQYFGIYCLIIGILGILYFI